MPLPYRVISVVLFVFALLYASLPLLTPGPLDIVSLLRELGTSSMFVAFALSPHIMFGRRAAPGAPEPHVPSLGAFSPRSHAFVWIAVGLWAAALLAHFSRTLL